MKEVFRKFSSKISKTAGSPYAFVLAMVFVFTWLITGPIFKFSSDWQLIINTITNVITFMMVFVIQNSQNHDTKAIQLKLDAILLGLKEADKDLIDLEDLSDQELEKLDNFYALIAEKRREDVKKVLQKRQS